MNSNSGESWPVNVNMGTKTAAWRRRPPRTIRSLFSLSDSTTRDLLDSDNRFLVRTIITHNELMCTAYLQIMLIFRNAQYLE